MTQPQKSIDPIKIFIALLILLGIGVFFLNSGIHFYKIGVETDQYKKAAFCKYGKYGDDCRRETEAEILSSKTIVFIDNSSGYRRSRTPPRIGLYVINVRLSYGETYTIKLLPNLSLNVKDFMLDNVYLPAPQNVNEKMAETSFIKGHMVKIEMWKNKPSMIYSRSVLGAPALSGNNEYAIPTEDNPLIYDALERDNFRKTSAGLVIAFLVILTLFFL